MKRNDFVFCIGYQGDTAIVDRALEAKYGRLNTRQLFEKKLFKAALASAMWEDNQSDLEFLVQEYNKISSVQVKNIDGLKRAFGVNEVYKDIQKTNYL